jgi:hypothetical protein
MAAILGNERGGLFEVRTRRCAGGMRQKFLTPAEARRALPRMLLDGARTDVYVGAAPRRRRRGTAEDVARCWCLWADADGQGAVNALEAFEPAPSIVIASGTGPNFHAWWALDCRRPLEPEAARQANLRLAHALGSDRKVADPARVLRLAGTRNFKHEPAAMVECVRCEPVVHDPRDIVGLLPDPPAGPKKATAAVAGSSRAAVAAHDPLRTIAPTVYFPLLTGLEPGRDGKVCCPFHSDRTPSLAVYPTPDRGWFCFGC